MLQKKRNIMVEPHRIADATDAVAVAKEVTGFGVPSRAAPFVDRITIKDDDTPFLARQLVGTVAWRVEFEDISLTLKSAVSSFQDPYRRSFIVLIQEETGILWSVKSVSDKKDIDLKPEPSAAVAEEQLGPEGEIYVGLAAANPGISFLNALDVILKRGNSSPFLAKEFYAVYVLESIHGATPLPVWSITLRGIPPIPVTERYGNTIPVWQRNRMRSVVDANSGKLFFSTNSPQPK